MTFLGLSVQQCLLVCDLALVFILLLDSFQGHYRRGFYRWTQFLPYLFGGVYVCALVAMLFEFGSVQFFDDACWALGGAGLLGFFLHQFFGIAKKPGGYSWFLHYLMYGPTALAPLGLSLAALMGWSTVHAAPMLLLVSLCCLIAGSLAQSLVLHFRGAFNNPAMYLPYTFPLVSLILLIVIAASGDGTTAGVDETLLHVSFASLVLTALIGFIGAGMHLRGFDRQSGGLGIALFNVLSGPPAFAPLVFTVAGAIGCLVLAG